MVAPWVRLLSGGGLAFPEIVHIPCRMVSVPVGGLRPSLQVGPAMWGIRLHRRSVVASYCILQAFYLFVVHTSRRSIMPEITWTFFNKLLE